MAVTRTSRSVLFTAATDALAQPVKIREVQINCAGATPGDNVILRDAAAGGLICNFEIPSATGTFIVHQNCGWRQGLYVEALPSATTIVVLTD
jgi:hypothetical protein